MTEIVNLFAPEYDAMTGYGRMALELVHHFERLGTRVNPLGAAHEHGQASQSQHIQALLKRPIIPSFGGIVLAYPTLIKGFEGVLQLGKAPVVFCTMFESTRIPDEWIPILNQGKAVIVPSPFLVKVFQKSGVRVPIHVLPLGVSETYHYVPRRHYPDVFKFLCLGDRKTRKGWDVAVRAFQQAFQGDPKYKLLIKARHWPYTLNVPNVEIVEGDYSEVQMQALYASVHAYVFPTRGEGFGLPPREAAATGLPVLATNWGGCEGVSKWGYPINYQLQRAWVGYGWLDGLGEWAEPDTEHLAKQMQYVASPERFKMWHELPYYVESQDKLVAKRVQRLTWGNWAEGVLKIWQEAIRPKSIAALRAVQKQRKAAKNGH